MLRSGFGKQVKSEANTMPSWGFGTSHRDAFMKVGARALCVSGGHLVSP